MFQGNILKFQHLSHFFHLYSSCCWQYISERDLNCLYKALILMNCEKLQSRFKRAAFVLLTLNLKLLCYTTRCHKYIYQEDLPLERDLPKHMPGCDVWMWTRSFCTEK